MSQQSELFDAIRKAPHDLAARLVYADLLMGEGDPRGSFIAQQCRLEDMDLLDAEYPAIYADMERARAEHGATWLAPFFDVLEMPEEARASQALVGATRWGFSRGFVSKLVLEIETASRVASAFGTIEPLDGMKLLATEYVPEAQRRFPEVSQWRYLGVEPDGWFTDNSVANVLCWGLTRVEQLSLARCSLGVSGCQLLANESTDLGEVFEDYVQPPPLALNQLRSLDLRGCAIGDAGFEVLARAPTLTALTTLDLTQNRLGESSLEQLLASPVLGTLSELSLGGNNDLGPQLGRLASWAPIPRLQRLAIPQTTTAEALTALFPAPSASLRELILTSNKSLGAMPELVSACAQHFTHLDLGTTRIGDKGLAVLLAAPSVRSLMSLKLNGCSLSDKSIAALTNSSLERLNMLDLSSNKLSNAGLAALAAWPGLRQVIYLRLGNNRKLSRDGYAALAQSPYFDPAELLVGKVADESKALLVERYGARVVVRS